jgi:hypothetical protein
MDRDGSYHVRNSGFHRRDSTDRTPGDSIRTRSGVKWPFDLPACDVMARRCVCRSASTWTPRNILIAEAASRAMERGQAKLDALCKTHAPLGQIDERANTAQQQERLTHE